MIELIALAVMIEPVVVIDHTSDLFRGAPFNNREESSVNSLAAGVTITAGKWEIDLLQGVKSFNCRGLDCGWESATALHARWYPRRRK